MIRTVLVVAVALSVAFGILVLGGRRDATTSASAAGAVLADRVSEPVVLTGAELPGFRGAPESEIWAWSWSGAEWQLMHRQLDERDGADEYVTVEDGVLDDNDEVVLMADELGEARPTANPPGMGMSPPVELVAQDPLAPGSVGYAYIFRSATGPRIGLPPLVTMDAATAEIRSSAYTLGYARASEDGFVGIKRLSLHDGTADVLDRMKIRLTLDAFGLPLALNEQTLGQYGIDLVPTPVISGPVRLILDPAGASYAYAGRLSIAGAMTSLDAPIPLPIKDIRFSLDLAADGLPAAYSDANVPQGVPVDGSADAVPASPMPAWREIRTSAGRVVMIAVRDVSGSNATVYYKDDNKLDASDTGDMFSYGDQGVAAADAAAFASSGFPGEMIIPPPGNDVAAPRILEQSRSPLVVTLTGGPDTPTPGPTGAAATRTPTATRTRPVTRTPTSTGPTETPAAHIHLPALFDNA